jgi:methylaspartate mutase epsilon subunit
VDGLTAFVRRSAEAGHLVVQPRMGFGRVEEMLAGLRAVRAADAVTVGTLTLDSFTRLNDFAGAAHALMSGAELNGFPLVTHGADTTRQMLGGLSGNDFPIQVRHGCALPGTIMRTAVDAGIDATEGGPVSYSLPYGKVPIDAAVRDWSAGVEECVRRSPGGFHLETFGGCMLGQLCPPALLVAIAVLEALFFRQHGVSAVSLSYTQQSSPEQDREAVAALRRLAGESLPDVDWHVVVYTFMGLFPATEHGARRIVAESVRLAVESGAERLIVKTPVESQRIPTIAENVAALEFAARCAERGGPPPPVDAEETYQQARTLVDATLELSADVGQALVLAVRKGYLDVPFCLHPDNARRSGCAVGADGRLRWTTVGRMPIAPSAAERSGRDISSGELLDMLEYTRRRCDGTPFPDDIVMDIVDVRSVRSVRTVCSGQADCGR